MTRIEGYNINFDRCPYSTKPCNEWKCATCVIYKREKELMKEEDKDDTHNQT